MSEGSGPYSLERCDKVWRILASDGRCVWIATYDSFDHDAARLVRLLSEEYLQWEAAFDKRIGFLRAALRM